MNSKDLIEELAKITQENLDVAQTFMNMPIEKLQKKGSPTSWNALECIEHLNRYGDFYLPEIQKRLENANVVKSTIFRTGFLGNYFAKSLMPKNKTNKMKTFTKMDPLNSILNKTVLETFIVQQKEILKLLQKSENYDLSRIKTSISISKWIKLRLGDTFRVVIYHNLRHIEQAKRVINQN